MRVTFLTPLVIIPVVSISIAIITVMIDLHLFSDGLIMSGFYA